MLKPFNQFIQKHNLCEANNTILVATSGGADSICLATLFLKLGYTISLAHCNFQLRGADSVEDEQFVKAFAEKHQIPFFAKSFDTKRIAASLKKSIEETARILRYEWFNELIGQHNYDLLATAHHADDNSETFLLNLIKGRGIQGQVAILPKLGNLIRPLLFASKKEILAYCEKEHIAFRVDKSNNDINFQRNFLRHKVIPLLTELNPSLNQAFNHEINYRRAANSVFKQYIKSQLTTISNENEIKLVSLFDDPNGTFVLYTFLEPYGFNFSQISQILANKASGKEFLSSTHRAITHHNSLFVELLQTNKFESFIINELGEIFTPIYLAIEQIAFDSEDQPPTKETVYFDADKVSFPLTLRNWQKGDYFFPTGMKGRKKLSDYFIDNKFSLLEKEKTWLVCSENEPIWIVGHRADRRFVAEKSSKNVLKLSFSKPVNH